MECSLLTRHHSPVLTIHMNHLRECWFQEMDTLSCSFYKWGDRPREIKQLAQSHTASERWRICLTSADTKPCSFNLWAILLWVVCIKHKGCGNQEESLTRVGCLGAGRREARPLWWVTPELDKEKPGRGRGVGRAEECSQILRNKMELHSNPSNLACYLWILVESLSCTWKKS